MTVVRPPAWPAVTPPASGGAGKTAAQRAFFEAALGKAGAPTAQPQAVQTPAIRAETVPQPAAQRLRNETFQQPAEQPQRILRPGSLLDIKV